MSSTSGLTAHGHGLAPLGARDQRLYREIMALQDEARWDAADVLIGRLRDPLLLGHVQRQRYMHPDAYRSTYEELHAWLEHYGDHPDADPRLPPGADAPPGRRAGTAGTGRRLPRRLRPGAPGGDRGRLAQRKAALRRRGRDGARMARRDRQAGRQPAAGSRGRASGAAGDPQARRRGRDRPRTVGGRRRLARRRRRPGGAQARAPGRRQKRRHRAGDPLDRRLQRLADRPERSGGTPLHGPDASRGRPSERALARGVLGGTRLYRRAETAARRRVPADRGRGYARHLWPAGARGARRGGGPRLGRSRGAGRRPGLRSPSCPAGGGRWRSARSGRAAWPSRRSASSPHG